MTFFVAFSFFAAGFVVGVAAMVVIVWQWLKI
jgi:hypothetical protein